MNSSQSNFKMRGEAEVLIFSKRASGIDNGDWRKQGNTSAGCDPDPRKKPMPCAQLIFDKGLKKVQWKNFNKWGWHK